MDLALGLIETKGLVGAIEAADAMVKAADVKIISKEKVTGALIIIKVIGETAAVKSAVDAGSVSAQRVGQLISAHVIPRPDDQIDFILYDKDHKGKTGSKKESGIKKNIIAEPKKEDKKVKVQTKNDSIKIDTAKSKKTSDAEVKIEEKKTEPSKTVLSPSSKIPTMNELVVLNVHALRRIARGIEQFPIKGREISKANRGKLLDYFKDLQ